MPRPSSTTSTASSRTSAPAAPTSGTPYSDVWESRPELVLALVDRMRLAGDDQSPIARHDAVAADRDAATAEVLAGLGDDEATKGLLLAGQASALRFMGWRERTKTNCVKAVHEQRMALRELGPASGRTGRARPTEAGVHAPGRRARRLHRRPCRVRRPLSGARGRLAPPLGPRTALLRRGGQGRAAAQLTPRQGRRGRDRGGSRATSSRADRAARAWSRGRRG